MKMGKTGELIVFYLSSCANRVLKRSTDKQLKQQLIDRITENTEKYSPNFQWYIKIYKIIFQYPPELIEKKTIKQFKSRLVSFIQKENYSFLQYAFEEFYSEFNKKMAELEGNHEKHQDFDFNEFYQILLWIFSEYVNLPTSKGIFNNFPLMNEFFFNFSKLLDFPKVSADTKNVIFIVLSKLLHFLPHPLPSASSSSISDLNFHSDLLEFLNVFKNSRNLNLQQTVYEYFTFLSAPPSPSPSFPSPSSFLAFSIVDADTFTVIPFFFSFFFPFN